MMLEQLVRQRDMYRELYEKTMKGDEGGPIQGQGDQPMGLKSPPGQKKAVAVSPSVVSAKDVQIQELQKRHEILEAHLKEIKAEYEEYRKERRTNEQMLTDQMDAWVTRIRELTVENSKLTTQCEYQVERFNVLKGNLASQKSQIAALEEKCANYSSLIAKHEESIKRLMDEALAAQTKLSKVEVEAESLREENRHLRDTEARLRLEKESRDRETTTQALLMANLESIKTALDRTEAEGRMRLEQRLDDATRECNALRRRLQEEQEHFRELAAGLERQTAAAVARQEEERAVADRARQELMTARNELEKKTALVEQLDARVREAARTPPVVIQKKDDQMSALVRQLEGRLVAAENQIKALREQLAQANDHTLQFRNIAESAEKQAQEMAALHKKEVDDLENRLKAARSTEEELRERTEQLQQRVAELEAVGNQSMTDLSERAAQSETQVHALVKEKQIVEEEREVIRSQLDEVIAQLQIATESRKEAEEKYAHEVVLHSNDIQAQEVLKDQLTALNAEIDQLRAAKLQAEEALDARRRHFDEQSQRWEREIQESKEQLRELTAQNNTLHDQLQVLGTQLALLQSKTPSSSSPPDEEFRGSTQLLEVVKFLRRESQLSATRLEALEAENARLRSEHELVSKQLAETREALQRAKREAATEGVTSERHQEILRKVETLNALTDSNRILRTDRDELRARVQHLEKVKADLELKLAPLEEQNRNLTSQADSARAENVALNEDIARWRKRCGDLIERANKTSPEDWKRLTNEREALAKQLAAERAAHAKAQEEARGLRQDKARLEEQHRAASRRIALLESELRAAQESASKQAEELNALRAKVAALEAEAAQQLALQAEQVAEIKKLKEEISSVVEKEAQVRQKMVLTSCAGLPAS